jgi:hypothetical protein
MQWALQSYVCQQVRCWCRRRGTDSAIAYAARAAGKGRAGDATTVQLARGRADVAETGNGRKSGGEGACGAARQALGGRALEDY